MKQLVTKKKEVMIEDVDGLQHCSAVTTRSLSQKKSDPRAFTIPYTIGTSRFSKALSDLGANINLMPLVIFKQLGLNPLEPTSIQLLMADRMMKKPLGISFDMIVRVDNFIFPVDFIILDCEVDTEMPIILERLFMAISKAMVNMEKGELKFKVNGEETMFNV
ncbi:uncharacterized protein LOC107841341 [Capsicum annuum]|uniref:uncharacterized protein LOC107841341 n=1 Tax=Capsicum annuum TaxID=4072 RepID=UPI001FB16DAC|nr:uncharacterized protein LOC107841341 [Capsicum annuum]